MSMVLQKVVLIAGIESGTLGATLVALGAEVTLVETLQSFLQ